VSSVPSGRPMSSLSSRQPFSVSSRQPVSSVSSLQRPASGVSSARTISSVSKRSVSHTLRPLDGYEEQVLIDFEAHAQGCATCKLTDHTRLELCETGHQLSQTVLRLVTMSGQDVYRKPVEIKPSVRLEVPEDMFPQSLKMLSLAGLGRQNQTTHKAESLNAASEATTPAAATPVAATPVAATPAAGEPRFRALQSKIQNLSHAASRLGSSSSRNSSKSQSSLEKRVLAHLKDDLKSRPGSYIGQNTNAIASALQQSPVAVSTALRGLEALDLVHQTVDENTWVVSHPSDLPVLKETGRRERSRRGSIERGGSKDKHQENLERVLAGDMKEEELSRFAET
jgi:hypothetical protein